MRAWIIGAAAFVVLLFASIWVGSWAAHKYSDTWIPVPAALSMIVLIAASVVGIVFCICGAMNAKDQGR